MQIKIILLFIAYLFIHTISAQVTEDFSDGNFTENPTWVGDDSLWQVNGNLQLQSKGTLGTAKDIYLTTQNTSLNNTEWRISIRFNLSPSTQNFCRYYLSADQINLKGSLNGYYIQFGGSTGNTDTISLYKQEGNKRTPIIAGRSATITKTNNIVDIKVNRDATGNWILYSDTSATQNYTLEGSAFDNTFITSAYTGFYARFTSGNVSNFYLNNVYIGEPIIDKSAPQITSFTLVNDSSMQLDFNERISSSTSLDMNNYQLNQVFPSVQNVLLVNNAKSILIQFDAAFVSTISYTLLIKSITDLANNKMADTSVAFVFYKPSTDDIVINEIMPDPSPSVGLPDAEYIELYNRSAFPININNWQIQDMGSSATLPNYTIQSEEYLILANPTNEGLFKPYGKTIAVPFLPGLNNDGDAIRLLDNNNNIINQIKYDLTWYKDNTKKEGGWSMELMGIYTLCKGTENWTASNAIKGGTPGTVNSVANLLADITKPIIKSWYYTGEKDLTLVFSEKMDSLSMKNVRLAVNNNGIASITVKGLNFDTLSVLFNNNFTNQLQYVVSIDSVFDCSLNKIANNTNISFTYIPIKKAQQNDIVITEIYANPIANAALPNAEYIELFNRSENIISLRDFKIRSGNTGFTNIPNILLYPDSFLVICDDSKISLFGAYRNVIAVASFPTLSVDDEIVLSNENDYIIHQIAYKQTWYNDNVKAKGGWSLEMIDTKNPCGLASNWTASKSITGGSIGQKNSVKGISQDNIEPILLRVYPKNNQTLELYFDKTLDSLSTNKQNPFTITPSLNGSFTFEFKDDFFTQLQLKFQDSLLQNTVYTIKMDSAKDCVGNRIRNDEALVFGLTRKPDSLDIVINEVLFNPHPDGVDFVEIYNKTTHFLDLKEVYIGNGSAARSIDDFYPIADSGYMLAPKEYYVISTNAHIIKQQYQVLNPKNNIEIKTLPSYNDNSGAVFLFSKQTPLFDALYYDDKMHFALIDNAEGVSLERIDFNRATHDVSNWTSASRTSGFATPTYKNSQYLKGDNKALLLNIDPEVFTPNNDGVNDVVNFTYKLDKNNYTGTLHIYNANGTLVKTILNNTPLGMEGIISWNGLSESNQALPVGIYIAYFDYFNTDGTTDAIKKTLVIAKTL